jgi:hypothetical protein
VGGLPHRDWDQLLAVPLSLDLVGNSQVTPAAVLMAKIHALAKLVCAVMKSVLFSAVDSKFYDRSTE